jgi:hypothetical protein
MEHGLKILTHVFKAFVGLLGLILALVGLKKDLDEEDKNVVTKKYYSDDEVE